MEDSTKSVLVVGFNTRPLAYSLKNANYDVYTVDFFGDVDLYPNVKDNLVLIKELETDYNSIKDKYSKLLSDFTLQMLRKYPEINYLIIGSGLDDAYEERETILSEIKNKKYKIKSLNNDIKTFKKARNIENIYDFLKLHKINVPFTIYYDNRKSYEGKLQFPIIFKKFKSAGGINVFKIENYEELSTIIKNIRIEKFIPTDWLIQEYIEGIPISCTTISNGNECEVITVNRQIIGEKLLNSPKEFMYCGNVVPAGLPKKDEKLISMISKTLAIELGLKGINGFDFVLKDHYPFLMECNPRIPGSISASESVLNLNLLDLHIKSFIPNEWRNIKKLINSAIPKTVATKLIFFAPKEINKNLLPKINTLKFIHDKTEPVKNVLKGEPLCTILYEAINLSESFNGAKKIVNKINKIIG